MNPDANQKENTSSKAKLGSNIVQDKFTPSDNRGYDNIPSLITLKKW